ncbi:MAG TPA: hypothetical protein PLA59_01215, partial [Myxococcota bacterium]|nr:hypothetical protein [Myxococcota bacterium]
MHKSPKSFVSHTLKLLGATLFVVLLPKPALAIANPFTLVFMAGLGWQLIAALVLLIPVWFYGLSVGFRAWPSYLRYSLIALLTLVITALFHFLVPDTPNHLYPSDKRESFS